MSVFEIMMLICFGSAWPFSIYRTYTSKVTSGKSIVFLVVLLVGYMFGILNKIFYSFDIVVYLYVLNLIMVFIDLMLYLRNRSLYGKQ